MLTHAYADLRTGIRLHYVTEGEGEKELFASGPLRPYKFEYLKELVPHVTLQAIPDGSHVLIYDHADEVNTLIQQFLEGQA